jgi:thiosulfate/3-mercaptopyruvate sulfurtransferase
MTLKFVKSGLIQPQELSDLLREKTPVRILDASYVLPGSPDPEERWREERIEDAAFFSIEKISDHASPLPHMLPAEAAFADAVGDLGISSSDFIVLYGQNNTIMGPARAWWMFRVFGHDNVCVLDGGLPAWKKAGLPVNTAPPIRSAPGFFKASLRKNLVRDLFDIKAATESGAAQIYDARSEGRFAGREAEPRPGLRLGHIPGSRNVPAGSLLDPETGLLKDDLALDALFAAAGLTPEKPIYATCGSGVSACMIALALYKRGFSEVSVYDGSWAQWGQEAFGMPVETA